MIFSTALRYLKRAKLSSPEAPPSLFRTKLLLRLLGDPQHKINFITVGGERLTDAESLISGMIFYSGYGVLTVDPSRIKVDPEKCIICNGAYIEASELTDAFERVYREAQKIKKSYDAVLGGEGKDDGIDALTRSFVARGISPELTAEEITVAMAVMIAKERGCRFCVMPAMPGGRNSPLNALPAPLACFFCPMSEQDCEEILSALTTKGVKEIVTEPQSPEVLSAVSKKCAELGARFNVTLRQEISIVKRTLRLTEFTYKGGKPFTLATLSAELINKACATIELAEILSRNGYTVYRSTLKSSLRAFRADKRADICTLSAEPAVLAASTSVSLSTVLDLLDTLAQLNPHRGGTFYVLDAGLEVEIAERVMEYLMQNYGSSFDRISVICSEGSGFCGYDGVDNGCLEVEYSDASETSVPDMVLALKERDGAICFFLPDCIGKQTEKLQTSMERKNLAREYCAR